MKEEARKKIVDVAMWLEREALHLIADADRLYTESQELREASMARAEHAEVLRKALAEDS